jgi:hypothetical protein
MFAKGRPQVALSIHATQVFSLPVESLYVGAMNLPSVE